MQSIEATGKSLNQAIQNGLKELNKTEEEVNVTILNMGGLFSPYKVRLTVIENKAETQQADEQTENLEEVVLQPKGKVVNPEAEVSEPEVKEEKVYVVDENAPEILDNFLRQLFKQMQMEAKFIVSADEERINISVRSENDGAKLIGHRGENLKAIQILCNAALDAVSKDNRKIIIDIENYRSKRDEILRQLAIRTAHKVAKTKKKIALEPMNSYERRIIHSVLQSDKYCITYSEGKEPNRHLVIDLKPR